MVCATGCRMLNPAFYVDELAGSDASSGSADADGSGSTSPWETDGAGATGSLSGTETAASAGESSPGTTGEPTVTSTTSGEGDASSSSEAVGSSTGDGCAAPCDGEGHCVDGEPPVAVNCANGCFSDHPCVGDELCVVVEGLATCAPPDGGACQQIESAYGQIIEDPEHYACSDDEECHAVAGSCSIPGGACWHVFNDAVEPGALAGLVEVWVGQECEAGCTCDGQEPPLVMCQDNTCVAVQ
ncbi:MAG: hypothetical protein KC468_26365 [Myxococcales bacterium]|nr:hypothetical protein [Myxococcales bacterium]